MVDYTDKSLYVEPFLHLWDEWHDMDMVDDLFDVFLDSVSQYFIEHYFASMFTSETDL